MEKRILNKKLIAIVSIIILFFIALFLVLFNSFRIENQNTNIGNNEKILNQIWDVDKEFDDFFKGPKYQKLATIEEKKDAVEEMLVELSEKGLIVDESIEYHENNKQFSFKYVSGIPSGVYLDFSFSNGFAGSFSNTSKMVLSSNDVTANYNDVKLVDGKSIMMYGWGEVNSKKYAEWDETVENCNERDMNMTMHTGTSVETYKTALLNKDFICIAEHGCEYTPPNSSNCIYSFFVYGEEATDEKDKDYITDITEERIYRVYTDFFDDVNNGNFYLITPKFFKDYYGNGRLDESIVYLSSCMGFGADGTIDYEFAKAFCDDCGAKAVVGFHNSVWLNYANGILDLFTNYLSQGYTIEESLAKAKDFCGNTDKEYVEDYGEVEGYASEKKDPPAYPVLYRKQINVSGKVKDEETENVISNVKIVVVDNNSDSNDPTLTVTTDDKGLFSFKVPYGSYSVSFQHDNYEYYGVSLIIDSGKSGFENPILLTPKKEKYKNIDGYMGQDIETVASEIGDMEEISVTDGSLQYENDYLTFGTNPGQKQITFISIDSKCNYSIRDIYIGEDLNTAVEYLKEKGWTIESQEKKSDGTNYARLKKNDYEIALWSSTDDNINGISYFFEGETCITNMECVDYGWYTGNMGDSCLFNLDKKGLYNEVNDNVYYRNGNIGLDGTEYNNGFEAWIARWNYEPEISWAYATYKLDSKYSTLTGKTNLISSYNTTNFDTTVYFYDGDKILASYSLTNNDYEKDIIVNVSGVDKLKILVKDNVAVPGGTSFALYDMFLT